MTQETEQFYLHENKGEYTLAIAILLAVLYAIVVVAIGRDLGIGPTLFGIGIYAGAYIALRDGFTGPAA